MARLGSGVLVRHIPAYYYRQYLSQLVEPSPALMWVGRAGASADIENPLGEKIPYRLNALGWRDRDFVPFTMPRNALVLGDSFSFGTGVKEGDRYSERLERSLGSTNVWNLGVMGYAPDQYLQLAQRWLLSMPWSFVVVQLSNNDLADLADHQWEKVNASSGIPALIGAPAWHAWVSTPSEAWNFLAQFFIGAQGSQERGLQRMDFCVRELLKIARLRQIPVILLQASDWGEGAYGKETAEAYKKIVAAAAKDNGAALVEAAPQELLPAPDFHWTSAAHEKVAGLLLPVVRGKAR